MSAEDIANAFIGHYYTTLGSNPQGLVSLYQPASTLTVEGNKIQGGQEICNKLQSFGKFAHDQTQLSKDVQMSVSESAMLIFVTGKLKIDENPPLLFAETFQLVATGPGQYYVHNQLLRLIYG